MKKFSFSFQYLLDAHRAKEQAAKHALHNAMARLVEIEHALKTMEEKRRQQTRMVENMSGVVLRTDYAIYAQSIAFINDELDGLNETRCGQAGVVEECRTKLRQELTSRRILENLCERERTEWADEFQIEEQKQMDELAVVRWNRQESGI